jgi:hypothetical protein
MRKCGLFWVVLFTLFSCILTLSANREDQEDQFIRIYRKSSLLQEGFRNLIVPLELGT